MLNNVPIARKLALLCSLFVIPVVFLAWQLVSQSYKAIDFASDEVEGVRYVQAVTDVMVAVSERQRALRYALEGNSADLIGKNPQDDRELNQSLMAAVQRWEEVNSALGQKMRVLDDAEKAHAQITRLLNTLPAAAVQEEVSVAALESLKDLAARAADGSKLILDPDLDSYYVMDLMVLRIPAMIYRAEAGVAYLIHMRAATPIEQLRLIDDLGKLRQFSEDALRGIGLAAENNPSGIVGADLEKRIQGLNPRVEETAKLLELNGRMVQGGIGYDRTAVLTAHKELLERIHATQGVAALALTRILNDRITALQQGLVWSLGLSILVMIGAAFLAWVIARGITTPLRTLEGLMVRLADGETEIEIPSLNRADEVGSMAKALAVFRVNARRTVRMQVALDCVGTPVLVTNRDGLVTDVNQAANQHFNAHQGEICKSVEGFDIAQSRGHPIAPLFQDSIELSENALSDERQGRVSLGDRQFDVRVNPIISGRGEYLGTVSEWNDVTERLRMEDDVARLVDRAILGDFSHRLQGQGADQFLCLLAERMNALLDTISASLEDLVEANGALAQGNLGLRIDRSYQGAFLRLTENTNQMADRLAEIVQKIAEAAHAVHNASGEIAQGSEDLASRTEQQAANLEETAAAMEELAVTVRQNAHNALQCDDLANAARQSAEKGGSMVVPAMNAMGRIEESSGKITEISTVIEEIAFQTNLLALNAAVEAARAGDAGRGFAVVAAEVRQLAQRTSRSSKEIKEIVQRSNAEVQEGVKLVGAVGTALEEIVGGITTVADIIAEIAGASREQSSGLDEVNAAVAQMDEMTQQNAALVEETTAAAHSLSVQAEGLVDLVSYFQLGDRASSSATRGYGMGSRRRGDEMYEDVDSEEVGALPHRRPEPRAVGMRRRATPPQGLLADPNSDPASGAGRVRGGRTGYGTGYGGRGEPGRKHNSGRSDQDRRENPTSGERAGPTSRFDFDEDWSEF